MQRLLCGLAASAALAGASAVAAVPTTITSARLFAPALSARTVAVVRPESGSPETDRALAEGLQAAGLVVVSREAHPALLVSYVTDTSWRLGVFANGNHAGQHSLPISSVNDNFTRRATVVAWTADAPRPTRETVVWTTTLRSSGISGNPVQFLPAMLRDGASAYGRDLPRG